eukprot:scaffold2592_cov395-Prasinococcus_capsulatus_cf.AAC.6
MGQGSIVNDNVVLPVTPLQRPPRPHDAHGDRARAQFVRAYVVVVIRLARGSAGGGRNVGRGTRRARGSAQSATLAGRWLWPHARCPTTGPPRSSVAVRPIGDACTCHLSKGRKK